MKYEKNLMFSLKTLTEHLRDIYECSDNEI